MMQLSESDRVNKLRKIAEELNEKMDGVKIDIESAINWIPNKPHVGLIIAIWCWEMPGDLDPRLIPEDLSFGKIYDNALKSWCPGKWKNEEDEVYTLDACTVGIAFRYVDELRQLLYTSLPFPVHSLGKSRIYNSNVSEYKIEKTLIRFNNFWTKLDIAKNPISNYKDFRPFIFLMSDLDVVYIYLECMNHGINGAINIYNIAKYHETLDSRKYNRNDY